MFGKYKREIGLIVGLLILLAIWFMPTPAGLTGAGQRGLALSLATVVWWAFGIAHPGFTSLLLLLGYVLFGIAPPEVVFRLWRLPIAYMVVGGFLIAAAVQKSGLGKRIAYFFILRYVNSFSSIIIAAYVLGLLLSILIPHPWPRSFLIMSVMAFIIKSADLPHKDAAIIGLAVFAGSAPTSMVFLTGDSVLNVAATGFAPQGVSWLQWLLYMGIPGLVASAITCWLQLKLFKPTGKFKIDKSVVKAQLDEMGPLSAMEQRTLLLIALAIILWLTDSIHGIDTGWVALGIAVIMAMPIVGNILKPGDWANVNIGTLFFLTAALAIGSVGAHTGMNDWVAQTVLPAQAPTNIFLFSAIVLGVTVIVHMILGSALAVLGIVAPALVGFAATAGINPVVPTLLVYTALGMHWVLPFHHMNILVGVGDSGGFYGDPEVMRLGIPLTIAVFIIGLLIEVPWWTVLGLL